MYPIKILLNQLYVKYKVLLIKKKYTKTNYFCFKNVKTLIY